MPMRVENSTAAPILGRRAVLPVTVLSYAHKRLFFKLFCPAQERGKLFKALIFRPPRTPERRLPTKLSTAKVDGLRRIPTAGLGAGKSLGLGAAKTSGWHGIDTGQSRHGFRP